MIGSLLACLLTLTIRNAVSEPPTQIFLLAGQSNMVGLGEVPLLPKAYRTMPDNVVIWDNGAWTPLKAQGETFGPEIGFAFAVATRRPKERIGIVKFAKGGTAIAEWAPNNPQSLYAELIRQYRAAQTSAPAARPAAMLWMQGEKDSREAETAANYSRKLHQLVTSARKDVGDDQLFFITAVVNPPLPTYKFVNAVRAAQITLPKHMSKTAVVSTREVSKQNDNLHYDAKGQIELGKRFAQAYLNPESESKTPTIKATTDHFGSGNIWRGTRTFVQPTGLNPENFWLTITEREGNKFRGEVILFRGGETTDIYKFEGIATTKDDGPVTFTTERRGNFRLSFQGKLASRELDLTFKGSGDGTGAPVSGRTNLKPE